MPTYFPPTLPSYHKSAENVLFIIWNLIILLTSLIGDSIILIATIKYKAIKLNKMIIVVMQHLAVCDLLQTVFKVLPITTAMIADEWVMGEFFCQTEFAMQWFGSGMTVLLTCALTTLKLLNVKFPLRTNSWSSRMVHKVCAATWLLAFSVWIPIQIGSFAQIKNSYRSVSMYDQGLTCSFSWWDSRNAIYNLFFLSAVYVVPYIAIIVTSVLLLTVARKSAARHGSTLRWEGVITVLLTVGVLLVSQLPYLLLFVVLVFKLLVPANLTAVRAVIHLTSLNIMSNFFVYSLTVRSFRNFLKMKISLLISFLRPSGQQRQG